MGHLADRSEPADPPYPRPKSPLLRLLRVFSALLPGDYLKTAFYLNCIDLPRRAIRDALHTFYRYDHVYGVLKEFREHPGKFSLIEFGTSDGYSFVKLLYATKYLHLADRVIVHGFDSFEGMPVAVDESDEDWITRDNWVPGQFRGSYEKLDAYCSRHYSNYRLHKGYFEQSIDEEFLDSLQSYPPILVWIDCDYYSSARTVFERMRDHLPNGCVVYFDDLDNLNYGSRLTGEARLVHEINAEEFGEKIELIPDERLSLYSRRLYRFFRVPPNRIYETEMERGTATQVHRRSNGSPLP
ncbi:MAG: class I SAM-dependent methyltransferase [Steroidobacteraceae bacterium]